MAIFVILDKVNYKVPASSEEILQAYAPQKVDLSGELVKKSLESELGADYPKRGVIVDSFGMLGGIKTIVDLEKSSVKFIDYRYNKQSTEIVEVKSKSLSNDKLYKIVSLANKVWAQKDFNRKTDGATDCYKEVVLIDNEDVKSLQFICEDKNRSIGNLTGYIYDFE